MTIGYQAYQPGYRPAAYGIPSLAAPRVPGLPAASMPSPADVAAVARDRPMLLGAVVSGGISALLLGWALVLAGANPAAADPAESGPAPVVVPAGVAPPPVPAADPAPVPASVPAQAPPPAPAIPAPAPVPEVITFDTGGGPACFPFQPC